MEIKKILLFLAMMMSAMALTSCGGDDDDSKDEPSVPDQTVKVGQSFTIPVAGNWASDNKLIAEVEGNTVTGNLVGTTYVRDGGSAFQVTVKPTITLFADPCLKFGASKSTVKQFMSGYDLVDESTSQLIYASQEVIGYSYDFENGKLTMATVLAEYTTTSQMANFLAQRYIPVLNEDNYIVMITPDKKVMVLFMISRVSGRMVYLISYAPYDSKSKSSVPDVPSCFDKILSDESIQPIKVDINLV